MWNRKNDHANVPGGSWMKKEVNRDGIEQQEESSTEGLWRRVNVTHMQWAWNGQTAKTPPNLFSQDPVRQNPVSLPRRICQESRTIQNRSGLERSVNGSWLISYNGGRKTEFKDTGLIKLQRREFECSQQIGSSQHQYKGGDESHVDTGRFPEVNFRQWWELTHWPCK